VIGLLLAYSIIVTALLLNSGDNPLRTTTVVIATLEPEAATEGTAPEGSSEPQFQPGKHPALVNLECPVPTQDEEEQESERHGVQGAEEEAEAEEPQTQDVSEEETQDVVPGATLESEWLAVLCAFDARVAINANGQVDIGGGETATVRVHDQPLHHLPGLVDSNSPTFWFGDAVLSFSSRGWPTISAGADLESFGEPTFVEIFAQSSVGGFWIESIWHDPATDYLYGWYHHEPTGLPCLTAPVIGAAISYDFGVTWIDQGAVLEDPYDVDCDYKNGYFSGGNGDFSVILDPEGQYFYFLYSNYGGPIQEQGIGIARSSFDDAGQPGTVWRWDGIGWNEPGIYGYTHPIIPADTSWAEAIVEAFWGPSVHWNTYLNRYVVLLNRPGGPDWRQEGVYVSFSTDLLTWTIPHKLFDTNSWYPQVVGVQPGESDTVAGQYARLYLSGISLYALEFTR
jgi:hypothetical protein